MPSLTLSIPPELKEQMDLMPDINWSEVARAAIRARIEQLKIVQSIAMRSKFTDRDAIRLGRKIKRAMYERMKKEHPEFF